jgi:phage-related protein
MNKVKFLSDATYDFLLSFDDSTVARIVGDLELLDELGYLLRPPKSKKIAKDLFELRIISNISIRIFYTFYKDQILILDAFVKKSQKIPKKEIEKSLKILNNLH